VFLIHRLTMKQHNHIGILLNRTRLTQITDRRHLVLPLLRTTIQLRQRNNGNLKLLRQQLQRTRELRYLLLTTLDTLTTRHELQIVDDDKLEPHPLLETTTLRTNLNKRHIRTVV